LVRVSIGDWEPTALDLEHDSVSLAEGMHRLVEIKPNSRCFTWFNRSWLFE
jgi:hypothetical protein